MTRSGAIPDSASGSRGASSSIAGHRSAPNRILSILESVVAAAGAGASTDLLRPEASGSLSWHTLTDTGRSSKMRTPLTPLAFARRAKSLYGAREAVVDGDRRWSYAQFLDRCDRWACALQRLG